MARLQPRICYHDLSAAVEFLERAFGFEPVMIATREGQVISAELAFGDARVQIGGAWENIEPPSALHGANTQTLYVELQGGVEPQIVDEHCERARGGRNHHPGTCGYVSRRPDVLGSGPAGSYVDFRAEDPGRDE
jgi:uncharacterized glyoxalase superfamily protein PhnB